MVTSQELKRVCRESNEKHGEKIVLCSTAGKKNCLLLIRSEKIVRLSWESKKSLIMKKNHSPPHVSNGPPPYRTWQFVLR